MDKHAHRSDSGITIVLFMGTENYEGKEAKKDVDNKLWIKWFCGCIKISGLALQQTRMHAATQRVCHVLSCQQQTVLMAQNAYNIIL